MRRRGLLALLATALVVVPGLATAAIVGSPDLSATAVDDRLSPGEEGSVDVVLVNSGDIESGSAAGSQANSQVTMARGLTVNLDNGSAPFTVNTGTQAVGRLGEGASQPISFAVSVDEDAEAGTYRVPVRVSYEHTSYISEGDGSRDEESVSETLYLSLRVQESARLDVTSVESDARIGGSGTVSVTVENAGSTVARDANLALSSENADVSVGQGGSASRYLGDWEPGEERTVEYSVSATESADEQPYPFTLQAQYEDKRGQTRTTPGHSLGITPRAEQRFSVVGTETNVAVGDTGTYNVTVVNAGTENVTDATFQLSSQGGSVAFGEAGSVSRYVGNWSSGETKTLTFRPTVSSGADARSYALTGGVDYEGENGNAGSSGGLTLGLVPQSEQEFRVLDTDGDVPVGDEGTYNVTLVNEGPENVTDATAQVASQSGDVTFGESGSATRYVGAWPTGEERTVSVTANASPSADQRSYALTTSVNYRDGDGNAGASESISVGLVPEPEQAFAVENVESSLRVGDEGRLAGELTNAGETSVDNVVLRWESEQRNVDPAESEYAVGSLEPGESENFSFSVDVSDAAESGPRQFTLGTQYRDAEDDQRSGDSIDVRAEVAPSRDTFDVALETANVTAGQSAEVNVTLTNAADERVTDISAALFADSPISADDDEAFVKSLDPGESRTIKFSISAGAGALEKDYPLSMDFQYEEPDGDTLTSDTYRVAVSVDQPDGGGSTLTIIGAGLVLVLLGLGAVFRYR